MIEISKVKRDSITSIVKKYSEKITAPLDDMWENMIIPSGTFYTVSDADIMGYFVVGDNNTMLQFYIEECYESKTIEIFEQVVKDQNIEGALAGTFEPLYLSLCLDRNTKVEVDTFLYKENKSAEIKSPIDAIRINQANKDDYTEILDFCKSKVGLEGDWIGPYYKVLLPKGSVYLFKIEDEIIGAGELRPSKSSVSYANLGMMVSKDFRKQNIGTYIMHQMKLLANKKGLMGICSTTIDNVASQKAIIKSGFYSYHRILKIRF